MKSVIQSVLYEHGSSRKKALTRDYNEKENCRVKFSFSNFDFCAKKLDLGSP